MKKYSLDITGSARTTEYLISAMQGGYLSHAYIFEGAKGSGRHTLVKELIKAMACENDAAPCGECGSCIKIDAGVCVDVHYIKPAEGKTELTVDLIRGIYDSVGMSPSELDFKAYVIENGEKMNANAQNAFLKLLEEPPANVYFFIITEDASRLLPTVRSRALTLRLEKLSRAQIGQVLDKKGIMDGERREEAISLADGSAGEAIRIFGDDADAVRTRKLSGEIADMLFMPGGEKFTFVNYHQKNIKKTDELCLVYGMLQRALRDVMMCRLGVQGELLYFSSQDEADRYSVNVSDTACSKMHDILSELLSSSDVPLNPQLAVTEYSSRLWDAHLI